MLASLKSSHEHTFIHVVNVGILTMAQAKSVGFTGEFLHAIGVRRSLTNRKALCSRGDPEETGKVKRRRTHDRRDPYDEGARYLMGTEGIPKLAVLASLEHHLKYDGAVTRPSRGSTPNIASQMISVADVFDAMRSRRPTRSPTREPDRVGPEGRGRESVQSETDR